MKILPYLSTSLALATVSLTSCASMMVGETSTIEVTSTPSGAVVTSSTGLEATTPCQLVLPNGTEVELTATHEDHPGDIRVIPSVPDTSRWAAGNVLFGGAAGLASDAANPRARVHKADIHFDFTRSVEAIERAEAEEAANAADAKRRAGGTM
ncbi:hypothetical protein Poly30_36810 [Planctomycetes bacterium Poly30]|uniref:PEGA domain protein n=1 Tax=Saltatorellus ferox TaxID=2528018 RepID=A0A518EVN2_9BACT|nr:hypothetical protein Poly30_36810 [Planctomycetes bacterium Poly30]